MNAAALLMIGTAFALAGRYVAYSMDARIRMLEKIELMFSFICNEIAYLYLPSDEIVEMLCNKSDLKELKFLKKCSDYVFSGDDFPVAWREALSDKCNTRFMRKKDIDLLKAFGEGFGVTDVEGQISLCRLYTKTLKLYYDEAMKEKEKFSAPVSALGLLSGIGFVIVFL